MKKWKTKIFQTQHNNEYLIKQYPLLEYTSVVKIAQLKDQPYYRHYDLLFKF